MKRLEILFLALSFSLLVLGAAQQAEAQRFSRSCERAESTSDTMVCVQKQVEDSQKRLNELYKKILGERQGNVVARLGDTQKNWIAYRNSQCAWEAGIAEGGYEKIYELSCIADLTRERIKALTAMQSLMQSDKPREFASHPRWMNALAADYPDVFWRYGQWSRVDLDCNGTEEEIMTGVAIEGQEEANGNSAEEAAQELNDNVYRAEAVIALSENVRTGRSKTTVFRLPIGGREDDGSFCNVPLGLEIIRTMNDINLNAQNQTAETINTKPAAEICPVKVQVLDGSCSPAMVYWDGESYQLTKSADTSNEQDVKDEKQTQ